MRLMPIHMVLRRVLYVGASVFALTALSHSQILHFGASLDGAEETPPSGSTGSGSAMLTLDTANGQITLTGTYTGLSVPSTDSHIHGPATRGNFAAIVITNTHSNATSGTISGGGFLSPAQVSDLMNGLHYVNVHTSNFIDGEIRGQLDLIPSSDCPAALPTDPVLSDAGGTSFLGPNINDALEPFGSSLDCSGAPGPGVYAIQIRPNKLAAPIATGLGDLWITGPKFASFSGAHTQNTVTAGPIPLPNDMAFVGLAYGVQGFCGGRLSNALLENIGLP